MLKLNQTAISCLSIFVILHLNVTSGDVTESDTLREPRIIYGTAANLNSVRHQVSIRYRKDEDKQFGTGHKCGASLISNNVVLTAAHCLVGTNLKYYPDKDLVVVMGNLDRFENNNNTLKFDILKIVKGSLNAKFDEDIALIILNGTVPTNHPTVQPIILNNGPLKNNTLCQATGWGQTEQTELSDFLRVVDLPLIDLNDCRNKTEYGSRVREGMFCAGYLEGGRDACTGDSGGPLVCRGIQAGIVSWGSNCGMPLNPGVYTDVAYYKDWIIEGVANYNASSPKFNQIRNGVTRISCSFIFLTVLLIINFVCL